MFRFGNFKHKNPGPWYEVIQNLKEYFNPNPMTVLQNHRTSNYVVFKRKVVQLAPSSPITSWFRSLHVSSELTRLRRASLVLEM